MCAKASRWRNVNYKVLKMSQHSHHSNFNESFVLFLLTVSVVINTQHLGDGLCFQGVISLNWYIVSDSTLGVIDRMLWHSAFSLHRRQMSHLVCSPPNQPSVARQQNRLGGGVRHVYSITLLFSHLPTLDPVTHIQRRDTGCTQSSSNAQGRKQPLHKLFRNSLCESPTHKTAPNILRAVIDRIWEELRTTTC